jgi:hypothetical protein
MHRTLTNPFRQRKVFGAGLAFGAVLAWSLLSHGSGGLQHGTQDSPSLVEERSPGAAQEDKCLDTALTLSIEHRNLLCASGIAPECLANLENSESLIQTWSDHIKQETERHMYRFRNNPAEFERSEGFFRMLIMAVVLAEDYHIHYDAEKITPPGSASETDGFFRDPSVVFLPGLLGPERKGTCSSMPVLYVAIGRKLGYPLKLVATKGHLFCRWDGNRERFNIEATAHGLSRFDDEYYRHWPFEVSADDEKANGYLLSLSPRQELAVFFSLRGMCLRDKGRTAEAAECFFKAFQLDPSSREYRSMASALHSRTTKP